MDQPVVRVGIGVIVMNQAGQFLMGQRKNAHGEGAWGFPGGNLEFGEDIIACAIRETKEETDLDLINVETIAFGNHVFPATQKHYITIYCIATIKGDALPVLCEPDKCAGWVFFDNWNDLPQPVFVPYNDDIKTDLLDAYRAKYRLGLS